MSNVSYFLYLDHVMKEQLDLAARELNRSTAQQIRQLIQEFLDKKEN